MGNMITEDYVSFETAKLLKEKGFDSECHSHYYACHRPDGSVQYHLAEVYSLKSLKDFYLAPTLQMAMKWLREEHKLIPIILDGGNSYWFRIDKDNKDNWKSTIYWEDVKSFPTYEEACETSIKYCLENLI